MALLLRVLTFKVQLTRTLPLTIFLTAVCPPNMFTQSKETADHVYKSTIQRTPQEETVLTQLPTVASCDRKDEPNRAELAAAG